MTIRTVLTRLRARLLFLLLMVIVGVVSTYPSTTEPVVYTARSTLYVGSEVDGEAEAAEAGAFDVLTNSLALMATSPVAMSRLIGDDVSRVDVGAVTSIEVSPASFSSLLFVDVTATSPGTAQRLANLLAQAIVADIGDDTSESGLGRLPLLPAYLFEQAALPTAPEATSHLGSYLQGASVGLVIGIATVIAASLVDLAVRSRQQAEDELGLPVLATIPRHESPR